MVTNRITPLSPAPESGAASGGRALLPSTAESGGRALLPPVPINNASPSPPSWRAQGRRASFNDQVLFPPSGVFTRDTNKSAMRRLSASHELLSPTYSPPTSTSLFNPSRRNSLSPRLLAGSDTRRSSLSSGDNNSINSAGISGRHLINAEYDSPRDSSDNNSINSACSSLSPSSQQNKNQPSSRRSSLAAVAVVNSASRRGSLELDEAVHPHPTPGGGSPTTAAATEHSLAQAEEQLRRVVQRRKSKRRSSISISPYSLKILESLEPADDDEAETHPQEPSHAHPQEPSHAHPHAESDQDRAAAAARRNSLVEKLFGEQEGAGAGADAPPERASVRFEPQGMFRARWDAAICTVVLYNTIAAPLQLGFGADGPPTPLFFLDALLDLLLLADVALAFETGVDSEGELIARRSEVRRLYGGGWFAFDLATSLPLDLAYYASSGAAGTTRHALRLPRLLKLLRLPRLFRYLSRWEGVLPIDTAGLRLLKLVGLVFIFVHTNACVQYALSDADADGDWGWVMELGDGSPWTAYTMAVFTALSHMLCIGYGTNVPRSDLEIWVTVLSMAGGATFFVILVGLMSSIMLSMDRSGAAYTEQLDRWRQYFTWRRLPRELRERVVRHIEARWHTRKVFDEPLLLSQLSLRLRGDVTRHVCAELLSTALIFRVCSNQVTTAVISRLTAVECLAGEYVYHDGQIADSMFFISDGEIQVVKEGDVITTLVAGAYFGEIPLLKGELDTRTASTHAAVPSSLYRLERSDFDEIVSVYPELGQAMEAIAEARQKRLRKRIAQQEQARDAPPAAPSAPPFFGVSARHTRIGEGGASLTSPNNIFTSTNNTSIYPPPPTDDGGNDASPPGNPDNPTPRSSPDASPGPASRRSSVMSRMGDATGEHAGPGDAEMFRGDLDAVLRRF